MQAIKGLEYSAGSGAFSYLPVQMDKGGWVACDGAYDVHAMYDEMAQGDSAKLEAMLDAWDDIALNQVLPKLAAGESGDMVSRNIHGISFTFRATEAA